MSQHPSCFMEYHPPSKNENNRKSITHNCAIGCGLDSVSLLLQVLGSLTDALSCSLKVARGQRAVKAKHTGEKRLRPIRSINIYDFVSMSLWKVNKTLCVDVADCFFVLDSE
ncbi:hypothetical protein CDAR_607961 [Caerostris darwini]|uniref:Uncharacterized protein n=1 Tax=Caerostris darwini TaxID=1538125 RepID=A0AAV4ULD9_9ARAC|nr:hypothetical protein CDAR_607961 [Caerostris darwini]